MLHSLSGRYLIVGILDVDLAGLQIRVELIVWSGEEV
jgi:hypothetical protein